MLVLSRNILLARIVFVQWWHPAFSGRKTTLVNSECSCFKVISTCSITVTTMWLSCRPDSTMCTDVCATSSPRCLLWQTVKCQEIPLLPKKSACVSLYWVGKNFMAKSCVISTESSWRLSMISVLAVSWWTMRSWWAFQERTPSLAVLALNRRSSWRSCGRLVDWIKDKTESKD